MNMEGRMDERGEEEKIEEREKGYKNVGWGEGKRMG